MSLDDLFRQIEEDEANDALELATENPESVFLTPIAYAKARGIAPQRVYGAFRNKKLTKQKCPCGRTVVDVAACDVYFKFTKEEDDA